MIDTIALMLEVNEFEILEPEKFSPCASCIMYPPYPKLGRGHIFKCVQNPSRQDIKNGIYKPRLTLIQRPCSVTRQRVINLKIELSAPKFMKGNNFDELDGSDFTLFCSLLSMKLNYMGIRTTKEIIAKSTVSIIHYSKNFILQDHLLTRHVLDGLNKIDSFPRLDATEKDYRNNGHLIKWHANSYEICLYDKVKDLRQARVSQKRAFEKDQYCQTSHLDELMNSNAQVLRLEIRFNKVKLRQILKELGIKPVLTLKHLFSEQISKQILTYFWHRITGKNDLLTLIQTNLDDPSEYLENIQYAYPSLKPKDLMSIMGTSLAIQSIGVAGFKSCFQPDQQRTIKRLLDQAKLYQPKGNPRWIATQQIEEKLLRFSKVNLESCIRNIINERS